MGCPKELAVPSDLLLLRVADTHQFLLLRVWQRAVSQNCLN